MKELVFLLFLLVCCIDQSSERCTSTAAATECDALTFSRGRPIELNSYKKLLQFKHGSNIQEIPSGSFRLLPEVTTLYLSFNTITKLEPGAFQGLLDLKRLVLNHNDLASIENGVFKDLYNLIFLDLGANKIKYIARNGFAELINLEEIILSFNQLEEIPQSLSSLVKIKKLDLSNNKIRAIGLGLFSNMNLLESLNLESNRIVHVPTDAFQGLRTLEEINLKDNYLSHLNTTDLINNLKSLKTIKLSINDFACATLRAIIGDFQSRKIKVAQGLSKSNLTRRRKKFSMAKVRLLVLLSLSCSVADASLKISKSSCTITNGITHCFNVTLVANSALKIDNCTKTLKIHRPIDEIPPGVFANLPQLEILVINSTLIDKIYSNSFDGLANLRELDLYWNELATIPLHVFDNSNKLIYLNLGGNNLETLNGEVFSNLKLLKKLIISSNYLTSVPKIHQNLNNLELLDLSRNRIRKLDKNKFKNLSNLIKLNLKGNQLNYVEKDAFLGLKKLKSLNLERNELQTLDVSNIKSNAPNLLLVELTINNFPCKILEGIVKNFTRKGVHISEGLAEPGPISYHGIFCLRENNDNYV